MQYMVLYRGAVWCFIEDGMVLYREAVWCFIEDGMLHYIGQYCMKTTQRTIHYSLVKSVHFKF